jgi:hypothetical protein
MANVRYGDGDGELWRQSRRFITITFAAAEPDP